MAPENEAVAPPKQRLEKEVIDIQAELADLGFPTDGAIEMNFDEGFADAAQTTSERAKAISLAEGLRERLSEVKAALVRIEEGSFGVCQSCGNPIAPERLEAIPTARLCISCKQKAGHH